MMEMSFALQVFDHKPNDILQQLFSFSIWIHLFLIRQGYSHFILNLFFKGVQDKMAYTKDSRHKNTKSQTTNNNRLKKCL